MRYTHKHTLARSHIVTLLNLRFGRYVFGGILAKRICSNSVRYCYLPALDCNNNAQQEEKEKKSEKHDNTRTLTHTKCQWKCVGNKETKSGYTQMKIPPHACQTICIICLYWDVTVFLSTSSFICCPFILWIVFDKTNWMQSTKIEINASSLQQQPPLQCRCRCRPTTLTHNYFGFNVTK